MHVSYQEAMQTPYQVILEDLEFMDLENEYGTKKPPEEPKKTKKGL